MGTFSIRKTTEQFIAEAKVVHGNKYDYSKVDYQGNKIKVCIICPVHGEFWTMPLCHLRGCGCRKCYFSSKKKFGITKFDVLGSCKEKAPYYKTWASIILRSTNNKHRNKLRAYRDCTICNEWLTLSKFKEWFEDNENGYRKGYQIDKDILVKGNKEYSPEKCCFVPREINAALAIHRKGKCPFVGVKIKKSKFEATLSRYGKRVYLGIFNTPEEAFQAYKIAKEQYIKELAESYFKEGKITERVYQALMKYEVEITD